jgi:hypothetical protein
MCAEVSTVLRAVAADFFFNCWCSEIPSDNRIRHIPRCVHYLVQGFRLNMFHNFSLRRGMPLYTAAFVVGVLSSGAKYVRNWWDHETIKMNCLHKLGWISNKVDICFRSVLCSSEVLCSSVRVF